MRLHIDDKPASLIKGVFLDGKKVTTAVEFDTDAGWVKVLIPKVPPPVDEKLWQKEPGNFIPDVATLKDDQDGNKESATADFDWEEKILHGKVTVVF
jgi:hypothetical protein